MLGVFRTVMDADTGLELVASEEIMRTSQETLAEEYRDGFIDGLLWAGFEDVRDEDYTLKGSATVNGAKTVVDVFLDIHEIVGNGR